MVGGIIIEKLADSHESSRSYLENVSSSDSYSGGAQLKAGLALMSFF